MAPIDVAHPEELPMKAGAFCTDRDHSKDFMFCRAPNCRPGTQARIGSFYCGRHQRFEKPLPTKAKKK